MITDGEENPRKNVLVYSNDRLVRQRVLSSLGARPDPDLPEIDYVECATADLVFSSARSGALDLMILDGEAAPAGGLGIARQMKDEIFNCPPILVLIAREQDGWLAHWSRADSVVQFPCDPMRLCKVTADALRLKAPLPG